MKILKVQNCFDCPAYAIRWEGDGVRRLYCTHKDVPTAYRTIPNATFIRVFPVGAVMPSIPDWCPLEEAK